MTRLFPEPRERRWFVLLFFGGLAWNLFFMLCSGGWSLDDELTHFLRSRGVWEHPLLIFDVWTRIGRNLFHVLPAHVGLTAARLWTLGFAAFAVWLTTRLTAHLGAPRAWLVPLALWFQPWFVELSWGVLTQTPFLIALLLGLWFLTTGRRALSGFFFGVLPLIRHEGIALLGLWGAVLSVQAIWERGRAWRRLPAAFAAGCAPLAAYNFAAWVCLGELPLRVYFNSTPTAIYGSGPLWHFTDVSLLPAGLFTVALALAGLPGLWRSRVLTWPLAFYPAYFALHSVIFWKGLFASGGYYHFLMPVAPGLAIAAVFGVNALLASSRRGLPVLGRILTGGLLVQGLLPVHIFARQYRAGAPVKLGLSREPIHEALQKALDWQATNRPEAPAVVCHNVYAAFSRGWLDSPERWALDARGPEELPAGSIVIWEPRYSDLSGLPLTAFIPPEWTLSAEFDGGVRVFEKLLPR